MGTMRVPLSGPKHGSVRKYGKRKALPSISVIESTGPALASAFLESWNWCGRLPSMEQNQRKGCHERVILV